MCEFESHSLRGILEITLYDKVCQLLVASWWVCPGTPVFSSNKTDLHDITDALLKTSLIAIAILHSTQQMNK